MGHPHVVRCPFCHQQFYPDPRLGLRQHTCGQAACQKQRRRLNARRWRAQHPEGDDAFYRRIRRRDRRLYRRHYWATHPQARTHHAAYMRQWRARKKTSTCRVRDPYRDTSTTLPAINTYLQVVGVREANRVITVKLLSPQQFLPVGAP